MGPDAGAGGQHLGLPAVRERPDPVGAARAAAAGATTGSAIRVREPAERALALALLRLPAAVGATDREHAPHTLCGYLHDLATALSAFYENCPMLAASDDERASRLALAALTSRALVLGLDLLGIEAPEQL